MRELGFDCRYDAGADRLMDLLRREPSLRARSIGTGVSRDQCWLVERFAGPADALARVEAIRCGGDQPVEERRDGDSDRGGARTGSGEAAHGGVRHASVLERSPRSLVTYLFLDRLHTSESVYALAARRLDRGFIVRGRRHGDTHELRLLTRSEENIEAFYERLRGALADGVSLEFGHLNGVTQWEFDSVASVTMAPEQRETLRAAIERGYYETPREITVGELADHLDVPQSTVSYRLRQAEAHLAKGYVGVDGGAIDDEPAPVR
ncbi:MAG: helix-turn-helix domain-containing protein [Halolamina sp.]